MRSPVATPGPGIVERQLRGFDASTVPLDPEDPGLIEAADRALASGGYVHHEASGVVLLSDVFVVEGIVNGLPALPETVRLLRGDGRTVYVFRPPGRWAA